MLSIASVSVFSSPKPKYPTSWLDGLRGYAALLVFLFHWSFVYYNSAKWAYGTVLPPGTFVSYHTWIPEGGELLADGTGTIIEDFDPDQARHFLQLPILRLLIFGAPMVPIFFVVSGYALSIAFISLIRRGSEAHSQILSSLASATFRRPIRLFLPCLASTFIVLIAVRLGLYDHAGSFAAEEIGGADEFHKYFHGWAYEATPFIADSLYEQLADYFSSLYDLMDFFTHYHWTMSRYDIHLWTIPVEFRCSMVLFMTFAGTAILPSRNRMIVLVFLIIGAYTWGDMWEQSLFWSGMLLCEIDIIRAERSLSSPPVSRPQTPVRAKVHTALWFAAFFVSLYFLSFPEDYAEFSPFFSTLAKVHIKGMRDEDQHRFWHSAGATLLTLSVSRSQSLKGFFSNSLARYLGRISYALYLVHGPVSRCIGYSLSYKLLEAFGSEEGRQYNTAIILSGCVNFCLVIWFADIFTTYVDEPIVRFAKWFEGFATGGNARRMTEKGGNMSEPVSIPLLMAERSSEDMEMEQSHNTVDELVNLEGQYFGSPTDSGSAESRRHRSTSSVALHAD